MSKGAQTDKPEDHGTRHPHAIVNGVSIDTARFHEVERLAAYQMANALLLMETELQRCFGLRAEERQVFFAIVLASLQRFVRASTVDSPDIGSAPLIERGLVADPLRGQLSTRGGTTAALSSQGITTSFARNFLAVVREFDRLGVLTAKE
jgi:hypothetical protein